MSLLSERPRARTSGLAATPDAPWLQAGPGPAPPPSGHRGIDGGGRAGGGAGRPSSPRRRRGRCSLALSREQSRPHRPQRSAARAHPRGQVPPGRRTPCPGAPDGPSRPVHPSVHPQAKENFPSPARPLALRDPGRRPQPRARQSPARSGHESGNPVGRGPAWSLSRVRAAHRPGPSVQREGRDRGTRSRAPGRLAGGSGGTQWASQSGTPAGPG